METTLEVACTKWMNDKTFETFEKLFKIRYLSLYIKQFMTCCHIVAVGYFMLYATACCESWMKWEGEKKKEKWYNTSHCCSRFTVRVRKEDFCEWKKMIIIIIWDTKVCGLCPARTVWIRFSHFFSYLVLDDITYCGTVTVRLEKREIRGSTHKQKTLKLSSWSCSRSRLNGAQCKVLTFHNIYSIEKQALLSSRFDNFSVIP